MTEDLKLSLKMSLYELPDGAKPDELIATAKPVAEWRNVVDLCRWAAEKSRAEPLDVKNDGKVFFLNKDDLSELAKLCVAVLNEKLCRIFPEDAAAAFVTDDFGHEALWKYAATVEQIIPLLVKDTEHYCAYVRR